MDGLIDGKASGARPCLNAEQRDILKALIAQGQTPIGHGVLRWRLCDLAQILAEDQGVSISEQTPSRGLQAMECRKFSVRPPPSRPGPERRRCY